MRVLIWSDWDENSNMKRIRRTLKHIIRKLKIPEQLIAKVMSPCDARIDRPLCQES